MSLSDLIYGRCLIYHFANNQIKGCCLFYLHIAILMYLKTVQEEKETAERLLGYETLSQPKQKH